MFKLAVLGESYVRKWLSNSLGCYELHEGVEQVGAASKVAVSAVAVHIFEKLYFNTSHI